MTNLVEFDSFATGNAVLIAKDKIVAVQEETGFSRIVTAPMNFQVKNSYADVCRIIGLND